MKRKTLLTFLLITLGFVMGNLSFFLSLETHNCIPFVVGVVLVPIFTHVFNIDNY